MVSVQAPDRHGNVDHVLLGFDDVASYATIGGSFGALLGRFANRIAGGVFEIDGQTFKLSQNSDSATLHGGAIGFNRVFWTVAAAEAGATPRLALTYVSPDGDQGFPGELSVQATYQLESDALSLSFTALTTRPTVVNLSVHPYFNLAGVGSGDVLGHEVTIVADGFLPTDTAQIPTGEIRPVADTPFDFRRPAVLGDRILQADEQLFHGLGYDHCFVLKQREPTAPAVRVRDPASGRDARRAYRPAGRAGLHGKQIERGVRWTRGDYLSPVGGSSTRTAGFSGRSTSSELSIHGSATRADLPQDDTVSFLGRVRDTPGVDRDGAFEPPGNWIATAGRQLWHRGPCPSCPNRLCTVIFGRRLALLQIVI